jgi:D-alanyl-D-alanine carboxypeptidase
MDKTTKHNLIIAASFGVLALVSLLPSGYMMSTQRVASVLDAIQTKPIVRKEKPSVEARSALIYDFGARQALYEKESSTSLPLASLAKIITISYLLNHLEMNEHVPISKHAIATVGESFLTAGDIFSVKSLVAMAMVESSNDAVTALVDFLAAKENIAPEDAEQWIVPQLAAYAKLQGASHMQVFSPTGLNVEGGFAGAYGSAYDIMTFVEKTLGSEVWSVQNIDTVLSSKGTAYRLQPTNELRNKIPLLVGSKTGFTRLSGGNLLIITEVPIGNPVGIVVLGSSEEGRFQDVYALYQWLIGK